MSDDGEKLFDHMAQCIGWGFEKASEILGILIKTIDLTLFISQEFFEPPFP